MRASTLGFTAPNSREKRYAYSSPPVSTPAYAATLFMRYGASFFCLEKLGRVKGVSNPEMVAGFRGETLEEFLKTRNVPGAR